MLRAHCAVEKAYNLQGCLGLFQEVRKSLNSSILYKAVIPFIEERSADGSSDGVKHTAEMETKAQLQLQQGRKMGVLRVFPQSTELVMPWK